MANAEITPELKEKILACQSIDEAIALVAEEGIQLSDEDLDAINGGFDPIGALLQKIVETRDKVTGNKSE